MKKRKGQRVIEAVVKIAIILALAGSSLLLVGHARSTEKQEAPDTRASDASLSPAGIKVSFKLDPRLHGPTYGGELWVSPSTYFGASAQETVEARVEVIDAGGRQTKISPTWTPSDPEMLEVSPTQGNAVKITVKRAGQSSVKVVSQGISRKLFIKATATHEGKVMQVEITQ